MKHATVSEKPPAVQASVRRVSFVAFLVAAAAGYVPVVFNGSISAFQADGAGSNPVRHSITLSAKIILSSTQGRIINYYSLAPDLQTRIMRNIMTR